MTKIFIIAVSHAVMAIGISTWLYLNTQTGTMAVIHHSETIFDGPTMDPDGLWAKRKLETLARTNKTLNEIIETQNENDKKSAWALRLLLTSSLVTLVGIILVKK